MPKEKDKKQVYTYIKALQNMGYNKVRGHLYYTAKQEFIELL